MTLLVAVLAVLGLAVVMGATLITLGLVRVADAISRGKGDITDTIQESCARIVVSAADSRDVSYRTETETPKRRNTKRVPDFG